MSSVEAHAVHTPFCYMNIVSQLLSMDSLSLILQQTYSFHVNIPSQSTTQGEFHPPHPSLIGYESRKSVITVQMQISRIESPPTRFPASESQNRPDSGRSHCRFNFVTVRLAVLTHSVDCASECDEVASEDVMGDFGLVC